MTKQRELEPTTMIPNELASALQLSEADPSDEVSIVGAQMAHLTSKKLSGYQLSPGRAFNICYARCRTQGEPF